MLPKRSNMSADGAMLLLEGYLQKRKDTMMRWATYWFRLHNTTLFFYTQMNGSALHLKGNYYIYTVQSVREVTQLDNKRFMFEIIMKNGKRKMLAAETAALRQKWLRHLWYAMKLSATVVSELRSARCETSEQDNTPTASATSVSHVVTDGVRAPHSQPPPVPADGRCESQAPSAQPACKKVPLPNIPQASNHSGPTLLSGDGPNPSGCVTSSAVQKPEGDYDVLPLRKCGYELQPAAETEDIYDYPASYRRALEHGDSAENIYAVPSTLLRRAPDQVASASDCDVRVPPCSLQLDSCPQNDSLN
ncbi:uncharacterized protein LOC142886848 isoform X2 [Nelusetta ayraudi]|uniref:uncharacterized protein LOC142886848 isoform X2 n=1 Tax=Nelusetta ayraudi TaxID=303726 RepID=UPI003F6FF0ED